MFFCSDELGLEEGIHGAVYVSVVAAKKGRV
jgi:hypothetical protein